ncbi:MAG: type II toxin-antitoxin system VapC family toxin [candidate division NC10 bacterium]|nr:type II toxin-antitoxin system VapC family toxin [candidate division NC10 bacterium]
MSISEGTQVVYADTSYFYATLDSRDRDHGRAQALAHQIQEQGVGIVTTWEVIVETVTLLRYRYSYLGAQTFIWRVLPTLNLVYVDDTERQKALALFGRVSRDWKISLCDAISAVAVRDRLGAIPCLAFDDDFRRLGLTVI